MLRFSIFISLFFLSVFSVQAQMKIDVVGGKVEAIPVAIPDFHPDVDMEVDGVMLSEIGAGIASVITNNLQSTGLFRALPHNSFINKDVNKDALPRFAQWKPIGAQGLVTGRMVRLDNGSLRVEFRLWDVLSGRQLEGVGYTTPVSNWRRIAHVISDKIYTRMTGDEGYFDTRIVYIAESGSALNRIKRLAIMDQDGVNQQFLTDGSYLVLTPRFSPNRQEITFLSYYNDRPRVYLLNILSNKFEILGDFKQNMTFAPRFSPDGNKVIMSLSEDGNSDLYVMDLRTRKSKRLTNHPGIDTSPSYSPDGSKIVFNSDRGGSQQLYVMNADGSNIKRISFGRGRYATPVWSPRGDLVAFTKIGDRKFRIGVMRPNGKGERLLTNAYQDEGPTWSPNGRVLMFFRTDPNQINGKGRSTLWSVDLTGYNERKVNTIGDASDPAWSPPQPLTKK
ncbi:Tol-Pal system beta propeller repeat protein TolB [Temperatibacter marinus]|uniref:Tol-Pal system protein TolB n=1 Tax=Temperatibacter marinus TaxID=1456591 RepID=A0AA52H8I8_9PROT|nr:Tol-Pal system beta propeller repeat protein TolB [Temperatibacter marinus]WND01884.1 Tol-Pal system beta propeller repeat protein TolB [Temperatibacter marinus]